MERRIGHGYTSRKEEEKERRVYIIKSIYSRTASACIGKWSKGSMDRLSEKEMERYGN